MEDSMKNINIKALVWFIVVNLIISFVVQLIFAGNDFYEKNHTIISLVIGAIIGIISVFVFKVSFIKNKE
jgi:uncharacterized membrane protein